MSEEDTRRDIPQHYDEDEIDLFELLKTLWRWKWFVIGITVIGFAGALLYVSVQSGKPSTYTASTRVQVGKILDVSIESAGDLATYLQSDQFTAQLPEGAEVQEEIENMNEVIDVRQMDEREVSLVATLSTTADSAEKAKETVQKAADILVQRHERLYRDAKSQYENTQPNIEELLKDGPQNLALLWLDSYSYPSRVVKAPTATANPPIDNSTTMIAVATIAALFLSILLAFMIDALKRRIREEKARG